MPNLQAIGVLLIAAIVGLDFGNWWFSAKADLYKKHLQHHRPDWSVNWPFPTPTTIQSSGDQQSTSSKPASTPYNPDREQRRLLELQSVCDRQGSASQVRHLKRVARSLRIRSAHGPLSYDPIQSTQLWIAADVTEELQKVYEAWIREWTQLVMAYPHKAGSQAAEMELARAKVAARDSIGQLVRVALDASRAVSDLLMGSEQLEEEAESG